MAAKFLDITGMNSLWAKIKNTFVKLSDKGVAEGVASLDSDAKLPTSQLPVKNFYASEARTILVCRVPYFTSTSGGVSAFEMTCRWRTGSAKLFVNLHGNSSNGSNTVSILLNGSLNINELKFYRVKVTVDEKSYFDIYVSVPAYHRCFIAPSVTSSTHADYSVYNAEATMPAIGTNTDADETAGKAILIEAKFIAQGVSSSNDAPVKVDVYGNLSAVTVDSAPNSSNPDNLISSKAVADALADKANSSDIPQATTTSPKMDGTASAGSETTWARGDHRHPTDTSREAAANKKKTLDSSSDTDFPTSRAVATYVGTTIDKSSDVIVTYNTETDRTHKYWKFAEATFNGSRYLFGEWDVILQTNSTFYPFKLIFEAYKSSSSSISLRYAKIVDVKSGTSVNALGATSFYVKMQDGTTTPLKIELWCGLNRDNKSSIAIKELRAGMATTVNGATDTRANSWTYYPNDGGQTTSTTKPVTGDGYTVTQFTQMSDKFAYYAERIGKPSSEDGSSVVTSQVGSKSIPIYVKSDGSIDECDVKSSYIPTGGDSDAPVNGKALADALENGTAAKATALNMGQLGSAGRPVYIGSDGKPKQCDADIAVFIAEYVLNGTSTPFASILTAYNSGRVIILKTSFSYIMLIGVSLSSGGDVTAFKFEGFIGDYIQEFSVNSNNVWSYHSIPLTLSSQGAPNGALGSQTNPLSLVYSNSFVGNLDGAAARLGNTSAVGGSTRPVYFTANGVPSATDARFIYAVNASGQSITTQYKICVGAIGTDANTLYFT